ncbi:MAG: hypothetical protein EB051_01835 [Chlamydiia bacterium]|nr:hypothetical protein [Chlamydiia bacterium]
MRFRGKALYNLVKFSYLEQPTSEVKPWQIADYRQITQHQLFARLSSLGIILTVPGFISYAESCESPEELIDCLWVDEEPNNQYEEAYLILFELWRRLLPQKQTLSVFGDEIDHMIYAYDKGDLLDEDLLQKSIADLEDILDQSADAGTEPEEVFQTISQYCAHDIETFLYDYIIEQMDEGSETYASELLDGFYDYVLEKQWFDFLRARLFAITESEESDTLFLGLIEQQEEAPDLELCFEIARFVVNRGDTSLFIKAASTVLSQLKVEEDYKALLEILAEFYRCLDQEMKEKAILDALNKRGVKQGDAVVSSEDKKWVDDFLSEFQRDKI